MLIGLFENEEATAHLWAQYCFTRMALADLGEGYRLFKDTDDIAVPDLKTDADAGYLRSLGGIVVRGKGLEPERLRGLLDKMLS